MKVETILNQKVSVLQRCYKQPTSKYTFRIIDILTKLTPHIAKKQDKARRLYKELGKEAYSEYKKNKIPVWIPAGILREGCSSDKDIIEYSNILAIDIDNLPIEKLNKVRQDLFSKEYTIGILESLSGRGLYALIYVEDGRKTKLYYQYLVNLMKILYNIELDAKACNIARKRFFSFDKNMKQWIKPMDTEITPWTLTKIKEPIVVKNSKPVKKYNISEDSRIKYTHNAIWKLLNQGFTVEDYGHWYHIGCDFAAFEDGKEMFIKLCQNYGKQNINDVKNTWNHCIEKPTIIDDDLHKKWQGLAKKIFGVNWYKD